MGFAASGGGPLVTMVDRQSDLAAALTAVAGPVVGVDVERADAHRYYRRAALIQIGGAGGCVLVDPLAIDDLSEIGAALADRLAVLHAIENDLEPLDAAGVDLAAVADTAVAAAVLGLPTGLGALLEDVLGVSLTPDKGRFQRADWEQRPLPDEMVEYAAGDVVHLPALWSALEERLDRMARRAWYEQELAATIVQAREDRRDWTRTKGSGRLSPSQRAILRNLWEEREAIAREHDIAPGRLLRDRTLIALAEEPAPSPREIVRRNQRRSGPLRDHADRLFAAQQRGLEADPEPRDGAGRRWEDLDKAAYDAMRRRRAAIADDLGIDAGVLCPSRPLWKATLADPEDADALVEAAELRPWQRELLAGPLWDAYVSARDDEAPGA